jgi:hypothetical protein
MTTTEQKNAPSGRMWVNLENIQLLVPANEPICYLAEVYSTPESKFAVGRTARAKVDKAWEYVDQYLSRLDYGIGHVVVVDVTFPDRARRIKCLGRRDTPKPEEHST